MTAFRITAVICAAAMLLAGCKLLEGYREARSARIEAYEKTSTNPETLGAVRFVFDDLGSLNTRTLETNAMPWKMVTTAMVMEHAARTNQKLSAAMLNDVFRQYGWFTPTGVDNWPDTNPPTFDRPIGVVSGEIRVQVPRVRLEIANVGCAACHAGMGYDANGEPTGRAWLGAPNTSRYFDGYLNAILSALKYANSRNDELLRTIPVVHPNVHEDEIATIRKRVLPQLRERLAQADKGGEPLLPTFDHGAAGLTNGVAALKLRLNAKPSLVSDNEHGYTSIPDLYGRWMRTSVLYDGVYAPRAETRFTPRTTEQGRSEVERQQLASIVAFFVVPTMGVSPDVTEKQVPRVNDILRFLGTYRPQPFPGAVDRARAERGAGVYAQACASCHGGYSAGLENPRLLNFPNKLVPQADMNTDPERWRAITAATVRALNAVPVANKINAAGANGYVAPILSGLWATAPYLHNGSVPTLWHLMRPEQRPKRFLVGGHKLDFSKVGIALKEAPDEVYRYPDGYQPWSTATVLDTNMAGKSNTGHENEFRGLRESEKDDLLEYLKLI